MASSTRPYKQREIKFTALEERLLALLPRDGSRVTTHQLMAKYYGAPGAVDEPMNPRQTVICRLRSIDQKAKKAGMGWRLCKTDRSGSIPQSFWIEQVA